MGIGEKIREARREHLGLTQHELANKLVNGEGKPPDPVNVSKWERGVVEPRLRYVRQIAELAELPLPWFFTEDGDRESVA